MTVVPGEAADTVNLICDHCGDSLIGVTAVQQEADVVWTVLAEYGWDGSPFAIGPHRCPACAASSLVTPQDPAALSPAAPHGAPQTWSVQVEHGPVTTVLTPSGDIHVTVADQLREALNTAITAGRAVVLDLSRVTLIDSTGLGLLVRAHRDARQRGSTFCLAAPSRFVRTVLHTMRLENVFPTFEHRHAALTALAEPSSSALTAMAEPSSAALRGTR